MQQKQRSRKWACLVVVYDKRWGSIWVRGWWVVSGEWLCRTPSQGRALLMASYFATEINPHCADASVPNANNGNDWETFSLNIQYADGNERLS